MLFNYILLIVLFSLLFLHYSLLPLSNYLVLFILCLRLSWHITCENNVTILVYYESIVYYKNRVMVLIELIIYFPSTYYMSNRKNKSELPFNSISFNDFNKLYNKNTENTITYECNNNDFFTDVDPDLNYINHTNKKCSYYTKIAQTLFLSVHSFMLLHVNGTN